MGDNSTGSGGTWKVQDNVVVCSDNICGGDRNRIDQICEKLKAAGKNAISGEINPSSPYHMNSAHSNSTIFSLVGGVCWGTAIDYRHTLSKQMEAKGNNIVWGYVTCDCASCTMDKIKNLKHYSHDWYYGDIATSEERNMGSAEIVETYGGWVAGPDPETLTKEFLTGKGASGGGSTGVAVEGMMNAGMGESPQFWNTENYTPYSEIRFTNFEITEENPRIQTATFETLENIDMTSGRVAILITGDCNDFGGIIIKKEYDPETFIYKYQCQGFMDRIMANPTYVVANGSKTAHELIQETLANIGLPDIYLQSADDYDLAVSDETRMLMEADKELTETSDMINDDDSTTKEVKKSDSDSTSSDSDEEETVKTVTKTLSTTSDGKIMNTLKRKPVGLYDSETTGDFIRTLLYDYGINLDFYGDVNGIPHFEVMDLEAWRKVGWYLSPNMGLNSNYQYTFDITNIVTQVGIKNIQASNGNGEMYTSEELLGVNIENFVGRMGIIEDNPTTKSTSTGDDEDDTEEIEQIKEQYQDSTGRKYNKTEVLDTEGEPSCIKCAFKNGGLQPTQQKYKKSWLNQCKGCGKTGTLQDKSSGNDYKTVCSSCGLTYCQYCGYERENGKYQLRELFNSYEESSITQKSTNTGD